MSNRTARHKNESRKFQKSSKLISTRLNSNFIEHVMDIAIFSLKFTHAKEIFNPRLFEFREKKRLR